MTLKNYKKKRDLNRTPEPSGELKESRDQIFVVQKHDATKLHYDFRLQISGTLKSWVIPKGPSLNPSKRRLAIPTEDHPIDYANFEGVIPEGNYGAGEVIVWDKGEYDNKTIIDGKELEIEKAYEKGHITIFLHGKKLKGEFALIKTGYEKNKWLLIKKDDSEADRDLDLINEKPKSVISNKDISEKNEKE